MKTNNTILIPEHSTPPTIIGCWCNSPYHCVYWYKEEDDNGIPTLSFSLFVNPLVGFWQRVKNAVKYIFQIGSLEFDEWRLDQIRLDALDVLLQSIKKEKTKAAKPIKKTKAAKPIKIIKVKKCLIKQEMEKSIPKKKPR